MKTYHQMYLEETKGRGISYTDWLEKKLDLIADGWMETFDLYVKVHQVLSNSTEDERKILAKEIGEMLKDSGIRGVPEVN